MDNGKLPSINNRRFELKLHDKTQRAAQIFLCFGCFKSQCSGRELEGSVGREGPQVRPVTTGGCPPWGVKPEKFICWRLHYKFVD
jgi:hypothetical protein